MEHVAVGFESIPAVADEWAAGLPENFIHELQIVIARKRLQRDAALKLSREIKYLHVLYQDLLVFFDIEEPFLRWSVMSCPGEELEEALRRVAEWRDVLHNCNDAFPVSEENCRSYSAICAVAEKARTVAPAILAGFRQLDAHLGRRSSESEARPKRAADVIAATQAA